MAYLPWSRVLSIQAILTQASWVGVRLLIGYRALNDGADPLFLGFLAASVALPGLVFALPAGKLADHIGGTRIAFLGLIIAIVSIFSMILIPGLSILLVASAGVGLGNSLVLVGQQTFIAHATDTGSRDGAFGVFTAAVSIGQVIGPPAVMIIASYGQPGWAALPDTGLGFSVCLAFGVTALPLHFFLRRTDQALHEQPVTGAPRRQPGSNFPRSPGLWQSLAVSAAVLVTVDLMYTFIPVWATEYDVGAATVGLLLALRAAVSVVSRVRLVWLIDRFGRKVLLMVSLTTAALGLIVLPMVGVIGAVIVMIGLGLGLGVPQPLTIAWVISLTDPSRHGAILGLRMLVNRLAQVTLPVAIGAAASPFGALGIFWANAVLVGGAIVVVAKSDAGDQN